MHKRLLTFIYCKYSYLSTYFKFMNIYGGLAMNWEKNFDRTKYSFRSYIWTFHRSFKRERCSCSSTTSVICIYHTYHSTTIWWRPYDMYTYSWIYLYFRMNHDFIEKSEAVFTVHWFRLIDCYGIYLNITDIHMHLSCFFIVGKLFIPIDKNIHRGICYFSRLQMRRWNINLGNFVIKACDDISPCRWMLS